MNNIKLNQIGLLKIENIFFESYYPILFSCRNEYDVLFLCVCSCMDGTKGKWLITEIEPKVIVEMLSDKITIRDAFLVETDQKYTVNYLDETGSYTVEQCNATDWDVNSSYDLPSYGEYMDAEDDEFSEEIAFYQNKMLNYQKNINSKALKEYKMSIDKLRTDRDLSNHFFHAISYTLSSLTPRGKEFKNVEDLKLNVNLHEQYKNTIGRSYINSYKELVDKEVLIEKKKSEEICVKSNNRTNTLAA